MSETELKPTSETPSLAARSYSLLPCPFCGSKALQVKVVSGSFCYIKCRSCGTTGPEELSITSPRWNTRADQPRPAVPEGLPVAQEPKYTTDGRGIINRASGEAIPHDEPVFIFRARDSRAIRALDAYIGQLPEGVHRKAVIGRLRDFHLFSRTQADRMKEPDTVPLSAAQQPEGGRHGQK